METINSNQFNIALKNEIYVDANYSNIEVVVLALINKNYNVAKEISLCSVHMFLDFMYCKHTNSKIAADIKFGFLELINKEVISVTDLHHCQVNFEELKNDDLFYVRVPKIEEGYFQVMESDLDKIFEYLAQEKNNKNKFNFVRYFIATQRVISNDCGFGYLTQKHVKQIVGENKTVSGYNKALMNELKLVRYNNDYVTPEKQYCSTYFGAYDDEVNFNSQVQSEVSARGLIFTNKNNSNAKRSITQKINRSEKRATLTEKEEEIKRLRDEVERLKQKHKDLEYKPNNTDVDNTKVITMKQKSSHIGKPNPFRKNDINDNVIDLKTYYDNPDNSTELTFKIDELQNRLDYGEDSSEFDAEEKFIYDNYMTISEEDIFKLVDEL